MNKWYIEFRFKNKMVHQCHVDATHQRAALKLAMIQLDEAWYNEFDQVIIQIAKP